MLRQPKIPALNHAEEGRHLRLPGRLEELLDIPLSKDEQEHDRKNPRQIEAQEPRELHAAAGIRLGHEVIPAPAVAMTAEQHEHEGAERQNVVADDEVFQIQHGASLAEGFKARPDIEAENAGQGEQGDRHKVDQHGLLSGPAVTVHEVGNNVFQHGDDRGQRSGAHEHEEQKARSVRRPCC